MIPAAFDYVAPTTIDEALAALAEAGDEAKVLGGGQSPLPILRMRLNALPSRSSTSDASTSCAASTRTATTSPSAR